MYCPKCGTQIEEGSKYCQKCGAPAGQPVAAQPQIETAPPLPNRYAPAAKTNGFAIASLVLGIGGFLTGIASVLAIIFGFIGIGQINKSNGTQTGKGMATAGIILGFVILVASIIFTVWLINAWMDIGNMEEIFSDFTY